MQIICQEFCHGHLTLKIPHCANYYRVSQGLQLSECKEIILVTTKAFMQKSPTLSLTLVFETVLSHKCTFQQQEVLKRSKRIMEDSEASSLLRSLRITSSIPSFIYQEKLKSPLLDIGAKGLPFCIRPKHATIDERIMPMINLFMKASVMIHYYNGVQV